MITNVRLHQIENSPLGKLARNTRMRTLHVYTAQRAVQKWFPRTHSMMGSRKFRADEDATEIAR